MVHGDLFREGVKCSIMSSKMTPTSHNPYGEQYLDIFSKFERLKENILKTYPDIIKHIEVMWSCQFQEIKRTTLKEFIASLSLPPKTRLVPRDSVRGGKTETFLTMKNSSKDEQIFYKDASMYIFFLYKTKYLLMHMFYNRQLVPLLRDE